MSISDIKLYAMNAGALGVTTFTKLEMGLKNIFTYGNHRVYNSQMD